jgi:hypothetical protein
VEVEAVIAREITTQVVEVEVEHMLLYLTLL